MKMRGIYRCEYRRVGHNGRLHFMNLLSSNVLTDRAISTAEC